MEHDIIKVNHIKHILSIIIATISYITLSVFSIMFIVRIFLYYLFTNPAEWSEKTDNLLPDLGKLYFPALFMYLHWWSGVSVVFLGLIQILPILRRPKYIVLHRVIGGAFCLCCIIACLAGNMYIYTTGTVGGINMDIAFSIYGWLLGILAVITYITARLHKREVHREWALRLWAVAYGSLFYRLSYYTLFMFGYSVDSTRDFYRPVDMILDWWFFIVPLIAMEIYIRITRK